ncbi:hypothetical protein D3C72_1501950 [compost metagenome]
MDRPSWNCPLRLADRKRPPGVKETMPSTSVPRNSAREWKRMHTMSRKALPNSWFSIICADIRTSAMVCLWKPRWSPVTSSAPTVLP